MPILNCEIVDLKKTARKMNETHGTGKKLFVSVIKRPWLVQVTCTAKLDDPTPSDRWYDITHCYYIAKNYSHARDPIQVILLALEIWEDETWMR